MSRSRLALHAPTLSAAVCAGLLTLSSAYANTARIQTSDNSVTMQNTEMGNNAINESPELKALNQWSDMDQVQSQAWRMSKTEWQEYKRLMAFGPNAAFYASNPKVTPLWIMGFNAKTETERTDFARRAIAQEQERLAKEIMFDEAWNNQIKALTPNHPIWMSEEQRRSYFKARANGSSGVETAALPKITDTRVVAYVDAKSCDTTCEQFMQGFLAKSGRLNRFDVFVLNAPDKRTILEFGQRLGITAEILNTRTATLNFDNGYYARLSPAPGLPVAYRVSLTGTQKITP
jgi:integrating conjugative element protein (TIGR03759 family)